MGTPSFLPINQVRPIQANIASPWYCIYAICKQYIYIQYIHIYYVKDLLIWGPKLPGYHLHPLQGSICWDRCLLDIPTLKRSFCKKLHNKQSTKATIYDITIVYRTSSSAISGETLPFLCACSELRDLCHQEFGPRSSMTISATARQHQTSTPQHAIPTQL